MSVIIILISLIIIENIIIVYFILKAKEKIQAVKFNTEIDQPITKVYEHLLKIQSETPNVAILSQVKDQKISTTRSTKVTFTSKTYHKTPSRINSFYQRQYHYSPEFPYKRVHQRTTHSRTYQDVRFNSENGKTLIKMTHTSPSNKPKNIIIQYYIYLIAVSIFPVFFINAPFGGEGFALFVLVLLVIYSGIFTLLFIRLPKMFEREGIFLFKLLVKKPLKNI
jgi:hypothetical protein